MPGCVSPPGVVRFSLLLLLCLWLWLRLLDVAANNGLFIFGLLGWLPGFFYDDLCVYVCACVFSLRLTRTTTNDGGTMVTQN